MKSTPSIPKGRGFLILPLLGSDLLLAPRGFGFISFLFTLVISSKPAVRPTGTNDFFSCDGKVIRIESLYPKKDS